MRVAMLQIEYQAAAAKAALENKRACEQGLRRDLARERSQIDELKNQLRDCRLWVGRLSERLTAIRKWGHDSLY